MYSGHVDYNIKDIIRHAGEPKFKPLLAKLIHLHKLLFAYRLVHYNDAIPDIQLNIENRNAELTKPLLRLFCGENKASVAVEEIRLALSKFIAEKNELKSNSLESAMHTTVTELIDEIPISEENRKSEICEFTNEQIWNKFKNIINGMDIRAELLYSIDEGKISQKRLTSLFKSKFRAISFKTSGSNSKRGLRFSKEIVEKIGLQYNNEDVIKILNENEHYAKDGSDNFASDASDASLFKSVYPVSASEQSVSNPINPDDNLLPTSENIAGVTNGTANASSSDAAIASAANNSINSNSISSNNNTDTYNNNTNNNNNDDDDDKQLTNPSPDIVDAVVTSTSQIKSYTNNAYILQKSDASDASDASSSTSNKVLKIGRHAKTKAEQSGKPDLPCMYCDFKDPIEFDLSLHYLEKHRQDLIRLPIGKSSIEFRADYAVELSKKRLFESFKDEDEVNDDDEEFETEEEG